MAKKKASKRSPSQEAVEASLMEDMIPDMAIKSSDWLSTGSTLLNLALTGHPLRGVAKGRYFWIAGDSSSGKTFLMLTMFAEASIASNWKEYDLFFDDVEGGALMNMQEFFGSKMAQRVKHPPQGVSTTAESFYFNIDKQLNEVEKGKAPPFLWLLDSMDTLSTNYEGKKFDEKRREYEGGAKAKGDYGDGKAKINSTYLRRLLPRLHDTGCTLMIVSQTRDKIDAGMFEEKKTVSGGHALKFYATVQIWTSPGGKIKKTFKGKDYQIGIRSRIRLKKNRLSGKEWTVDIPIYFKFGLDDVGCCIDYLVDSKAWKVEGKTIVADGLDFEGTRDSLIEHIEDEGLHRDLAELVGDKWNEIEEAVTPKRKSRYS